MCHANSCYNRQCATYNEERVIEAHRGQNIILLLEILYKPFESPLFCSVRLSALRYERSALGCARPEISASIRCLSCFSNYYWTCRGRWKGEGRRRGREGTYFSAACLPRLLLSFFSLHFCLARGRAYFFFFAHFFRPHSLEGKELSKRPRFDRRRD